MISKNAVVETSARKIGANVEIMDFAIVRAEVEIGDDCVIHPGAVINSGVKLGSNVEVFPGAIIGKEPKGAGAVARTPEFNRAVTVGSRCSIGPNAVVFYDVHIGENTLLGDGASIREKCVIGSYCIISRYVTVNYNTKIGDRTKIMDLSHITGNMLIEDDVFISTLVGSTNDNAMGASGFVQDEIVGPVIRQRAMIGAGAILLPGIEVGARAVVGAGAVVSKSVPEGQVVMGVPARYVRDVN